MTTDWQVLDSGLYKRFEFTDFNGAFAFMTRVAALAEKENHHPKWENEYNIVQIWLSTHDMGNSVTQKDQEMAKAIDQIFNGAA
jgi:4a-hydroxytetrahydrobiopterin dehydratase